MRAANALVAAQNDAFRRSLGPPSRDVPGRVLMTRGIAALPEAALVRALTGVRTFDTFTPDNDPWHEHDCAAFTLDDADAGRVVVRWKIDYYASDELTYGAEDPRRSYRVLTIMLAEEY